MARILTANVVPPARTRHLGRPFQGTASAVPARFRRWHAPRANRWEYLAVRTGSLRLEALELAGITVLPLAAGASRWIPPGHRWRIAATSTDVQFELGVHADETTAADAPQAARVDVLGHIPVTRLDAAADPAATLASLRAGAATLVRAHGNTALAAAVHATRGTHAWHPLAGAADNSAAIVTRPDPHTNLADYMGRDHALIEAALAGALAGCAERMHWLHNLLARHLAIEERVLFPAYLAAGGNADWIHGLLREHTELRTHLPHLDVPASRRRFLLMLDGHDEKEEQIIYPDVMARTARDEGSLALAAMSYPATP